MKNSLKSVKTKEKKSKDIVNKKNLLLQRVTKEEKSRNDCKKLPNLIGGFKEKNQFDGCKR